MPKTTNVLQVLELFRSGHEHLRAADIVQLLGVSSASAYRYIADLEQAGLVERSAAGRYVLGPAIVELDRQIRIHDPLIAAARDVMRSLSERTGCTVLLSRLHGRQVVCVSEVRGRFGPADVSYERGRAMPLYRGATSKVIFAHLDPLEIAAIAQADPAGLRQAGLPTGEAALQRALAAIRAEKVYATAGEVDAEAMGWAVPIVHARQLLGSLSAISARTAPEAHRARIADPLLRAGLRIEGRLESLATE